MLPILLNVIKLSLLLFAENFFINYSELVENVLKLLVINKILFDFNVMLEQSPKS